MPKRKRLRKQSNPTNYISSGNWCGPGHTAGKRLDAKDMTFEDSFVPAKFPADQACKEHDIDTRFADTPKKRKAADDKFVNKMRKIGGFQEHIMGLLVENFGPSTKDKTPIEIELASDGTFITPPRLRGKKRLHSSIDPVSNKVQKKLDMPLSPPLGAVKPDVKKQDAGRTEGSESAVAPIAEIKLRPFHETQDTVMPYYFTETKTMTNEDAVAGQISYAVRLNSIVDCLGSASFSADPAAAADSISGSAQKPMLYNYWSSIYRYWTVTKSTYKITVWVNTSDVSAFLSLWTYHCGLQNPPLVNTGATTLVKDYIRKSHKHCHVKHIMPVNSTTDKHYKESAVTVTGYYEPGSINLGVFEDEFKEVWHKEGELPSQREQAIFILNKSDASPAMTTTPFTTTWEFEVMYHCQWKDLKVLYEYPTSTDDTVATTDPFAMQ
jgi:hypothetical protein